VILRGINGTNKVILDATSACKAENTPIKLKFGQKFSPVSQYKSDKFSAKFPSTTQLIPNRPFSYKITPTMQSNRAKFLIIAQI